MRRLILGGSFNPIHHGHLLCSRTVAEQAGFDRIVLLPSGQPPHKPPDAMVAAAAHRAAMTQLAVQGDPLFEVDDLELARAGPSYTIDTVRTLAARGKAEIHWLIGADMLLFLPHWHRWAELLREVRFLVMARPGWTIDWTLLPRECQALQANVIPVPQVDISASDIRRRVLAGLPIEYLTPPAVCRYIHDHQPWRLNAGGA